MDVPALGKARGVFEIFVPGIFLLVNFTAVLYLFIIDLKSPEFILKRIKYILDQPGFVIVILISFGFLLGMILRLFMTDIPDKLSAFYHRIMNKKWSKKNDGNYKLWSIEKFPYIESIGEHILRDLCDSSSPIYEFYKQVWEPRKRKNGNKRFFNFCKIVLYRQGNELIISELHAAESINRYISGMFYSLLISSLLLILNISFQSKFELKMLLLILLFFYLIGLWNIISRFRFIRIKEATILFDACYSRKDLFIPSCCAEKIHEMGKI
jgi:hypothetical protein